METYFPNIVDSIARGLSFFLRCFINLFESSGPFGFIPFLIVMFACFGSLSALLGLIGSGISATRRSLKSSRKKKG